METEDTPGWFAENYESILGVLILVVVGIGVFNYAGSRQKESCMTALWEKSAPIEEAREICGIKK